MSGLGPHELAKLGMIDMVDLYEDPPGLSERIAEQLGQIMPDNTKQQHQGVGGELRTDEQLLFPPPTRPFGGRTVSGWVNPWGSNGHD